MLIKKLQRFKDYWGVCIVIYGTHCDTWMSALSPESTLWKNIPSVKKVIVQSELISPPSSSTKFSRTIFVPLLEAHIAACPQEVAACIPSEQALKILSDKSEFAVYAQAQGLAHFCPEVFKEEDLVSFPCVIKRPDLNAGNGITIATTKASLDEQLRQSPWQGQPFLLQAFISGQEYVTHCVCRNGEIDWHCTYRFDLPDLTIRNSTNTVCSARVSAPEGALDIIAKFIKTLAFNGPCNVDYKVDANNSIFVFEINPRLGGSLMVKENQRDLTQVMRCIINTAKVRGRNSNFIIATLSFLIHKIQAILFGVVDLFFVMFAVIKSRFHFTESSR